MIQLIRAKIASVIAQHFAPHPLLRKATHELRTLQRAQTKRQRKQQRRLGQ